MCRRRREPFGPRLTSCRNILVGTSSWTDKTLIESGRFYPTERFYAGTAAALLRVAISDRRDRQQLLRHSDRIECAALGRADAGRVCFQHQGVSVVRRFVRLALPAICCGPLAALPPSVESSDVPRRPLAVKPRAGRSGNGVTPSSNSERV